LCGDFPPFLRISRLRIKERIFAGSTVVTPKPMSGTPVAGSYQLALTVTTTLAGADSVDDCKVIVALNQYWRENLGFFLRSACILRYIMFAAVILLLSSPAVESNTACTAS